MRSTGEMYTAPASHHTVTFTSDSWLGGDVGVDVRPVAVVAVGVDVNADSEVVGREVTIGVEDAARGIVVEAGTAIEADEDAVVGATAAEEPNVVTNTDEVGEGMVEVNIGVVSTGVVDDETAEVDDVTDTDPPQSHEDQSPFPKFGKAIRTHSPALIDMLGVKAIRAGSNKREVSETAPIGSNDMIFWPPTGPKRASVEMEGMSVFQG
eukprot:2969167-Rhodomonas_salina.1